jgi:hypothetical protein
MNKSLTLSILWVATLGWAAEAPKKEAQVPMRLQFVRSLELEGGAYAGGRDSSGASFGRIETRYLDPGVDAFVGVIATLTYFNEPIVIREPPDDFRKPTLWNWGINMGIVRGSRLWALNLMGASMGEHLAFAPAFVGEYSFGRHWKLFHRTVVHLYSEDPIFDSDQGVTWKWSSNIGLSLGYRIFASEHNSRNGPRASLLFRFENPKIPFLFPSLG